MRLRRAPQILYSLEIHSRPLVVRFSSLSPIHDALSSPISDQLTREPPHTRCANVISRPRLDGFALFYHAGSICPHACACTRACPPCYYWRIVTEPIHTHIRAVVSPHRLDGYGSCKLGAAAYVRSHEEGRYLLSMHPETRLCACSVPHAAQPHRGWSVGCWRR
ncbi:hypothetical protein HYPSUDRAFT_441170 [Hypholoma sublateritium FD-334 SS-4]|uniref:Uncharacterized protein n=1 Tax=Hypholoma sublateritium (strain FD-334 SS-4) TaxID=945553 RepID=A0A0D2P2S0_HYPSF|nr:hypothetical protein HYPSUDRAFT_441170 [Hypholoma sublateritium FD-334 SS-4]